MSLNGLKFINIDSVEQLLEYENVIKELLENADSNVIIASFKILKS